MNQDMVITNACLDEPGQLGVTICGHRFRAGEKYTILEMGWAVFLAADDVSEEWLRRHGETRPADDGCNELASGGNCLVTSHPVLVALNLRGWWHQNGRVIATAPDVMVPTLDEAIEEVRRREILNDFNRRYAGAVPGLSRWRSDGARNQV